jgi:hypothetical protein
MLLLVFFQTKNSVPKNAVNGDHEISSSTLQPYFERKLLEEEHEWLELFPRTTQRSSI